MMIVLPDYPVKPHVDDSETENEQANSPPTVGSDVDFSNSEELSASSSQRSPESVESSSSSLNSEDLQPALNDVSFGALAQAQESLALGKRKRETKDEATPGLNALRTQLRESTRNGPSKPPRITVSHRTSKHAPTVQSAKRPVSRKLTVFESSAARNPRDPRFDAAVMGGTGPSTYNATSKANKHYSFLSQYQDSEIAGLKAQIQKTKDVDLAAALKHQLMSMESKRRATETKALERSIRQSHRKQEKELIREGKKQIPYFLKNSEVKREIEAEKLKEMGRKQREKSENRKRKKVAGKEIKAIPSVRRSRVELDK